MFLKVILAFVALLAVFAIVVALQAPTYQVSRSASVQAPPAVVFAQVNDFHRWDAWSPWARIDPAMKQTFGGPPAGQGAVYTWKGNAQVGEGRMEIAESRPAQQVRIDLKFIAPFASESPTTFDFKPEPDGTRVTWTMTGKKNYLLKLVHLLMNIDKMVGGDFDRGLAQLKAVAEAEAKH